jgi:hypothetical protein
MHISYGGRHLFYLFFFLYHIQKYITSYFNYKENYYNYIIIIDTLFFTIFQNGSVLTNIVILITFIKSKDDFILLSVKNNLIARIELL